jgi:hypothetical protein
MYPAMTYKENGFGRREGSREGRIWREKVR